MLCGHATPFEIFCPEIAVTVLSKTGFVAFYSCLDCSAEGIARLIEVGNVPLSDIEVELLAGA